MNCEMKTNQIIDEKPGVLLVISCAQHGELGRRRGFWGHGALASWGGEVWAEHLDKPTGVPALDYQI